MNTRKLIPVAVVGALALTASAAQADTLHAGPAGAAPTCADAANPCALSTALSAAKDGDTVALQAGTYNGAFSVTHAITLAGPASGPRPVLQNAGTPLTVTGSKPAAMSRVEIRSTLDSIYTYGAELRAPMTITDSAFTCVRTCANVVAPGVTITGGEITQQQGKVPAFYAGNAVVRNVTVHGGAGGLGIVSSGSGGLLENVVSSGGAYGAQVTNGATARRSTLSGTTAGVRAAGPGVTISDSVAIGLGESPQRGGVGVFATSTAVLQLRGSTVIGRGTQSTGIYANVGDSMPPGGAVTAVSVIARGEGFDVLAPKGEGKVTLDHSNFRTVSGDVTDAGANQKGDPFRDFAGGDFHLATGSPALDAGRQDASSGTVDRDGKPRVQGSATDIGAYEGATGPRVRQPGESADGKDRKAPVVTKLHLSAPRRSVGLLASFTLNESGSARVLLQRRTAGRRVGKACRAASAKLARRPSCARFVTVRVGKEPVAKGGVTVATTPRALAAGTYRVTVTVTDQAGNTSVAQRAVHVLAKAQKAAGRG